MLLILFSLAGSSVALCTCVFNKSVYDLLARRKNMNICTCFYFVLFVKCYCFCLYCIKTKPYSANKAKPVFTDFFHRALIFIYFKKASCAVCGETWLWVLLLHLSHMVISLILHCKFVLILPGNLISGEKKNVYLIFWINMVCINLVVNFVLFWLRVMLGKLC